MDKILLQKISYEDLRNKSQIGYDDCYCLISDYLTPSVRKTLISNPNLVDETKPALNLIIHNGNIVGRNMLMPTKLKVSEKIYNIQTGGSYEINYCFRGNGLGTIAFKDSIFNTTYDVYIGQLYSSKAISIIRKLNLKVFELPLYYKLLKSRFVLESLGLEGLILKILSNIFDYLIKLLEVPNKYKIKRLRNNYQIQKETIIPEWVNEITLSDRYKFAEVHDKKWLQWCLDNKFTECLQDSQFFYSIYDKNGNPKGFFMTKVRYEKVRGRYKNVKCGTIVEWGSFDESELNEIDLNLLAIDSLSSHVDNITTIISNDKYKNEMWKFGFIRHGNFQFTVNYRNTMGVDKNEISRQRNWRIRYGGCNTVVL